jgi:hypothetical protein
MLDGVQSVVMDKILDRPLGWQPMGDMVDSFIQIKRMCLWIIF